MILTLVLVAAMAPALNAQVVNGDFESGNTGFTSGYMFGDVTDPATYTIAANPSTVAGSYPDWEDFGDHTSGTGLMLIANGGTNSATPVWSQTVSVTPNTDYVFTFWGATINTDSPSPANIVVQINGVPVGGSSVFPSQSPATGGSWVRFSRIWRSGADATADIELFDNNTAASFNDFALDDIALEGAGTTSAPAMSPAAVAFLALVLVLIQWYRTRRVVRSY